MAQDRYDVRVSDNSFRYEFTSIGPDGRQVEKMVKFTYMLTKNGMHLFNLAFGDLDKTTQELDSLRREKNSIFNR